MQLLMGQVSPLGLMLARQLDTVGRIRWQMLSLYGVLEHLTHHLVCLYHPRRAQPPAIEACRPVHREAAHPLLHGIKSHLAQRHVTPARQHDHIKQRPIPGNRLRRPGRLRQNPTLGQRPERLPGQLRIGPCTGDLFGYDLVKPMLSVDLPGEQLRVLAAVVVDVSCSPPLPLAVLGAGHGLRVSLCVADGLCPTVGDAGPTIPSHP
jgi:hypothetical protein